MTSKPDDYLSDEVLKAALPKLLRRRARLYALGLLVTLVLEVIGTVATRSSHRLSVVIAQIVVIVLVTALGLAVASKPARQIGRTGYSVDERKNLNMTSLNLTGGRRLWVAPAGGAAFSIYFWLALGPGGMAIYASFLSAGLLVFLLICTVWQQIFGPHANDLQAILGFRYHSDDPIFDLPAE